MAIATLQGHTQRAIDFYNRESKFFVIGGTTPWADENSPDSPSASDYRLKDIVGYKRVDNYYLLVPVTDEDIERYGYTNLIEYRTQKWRKVDPPFSTTVSTTGVPATTQVIPLTSLPSGLIVGSKVRIANTYEGFITAVDSKNNQITIDTPAPVNITSGSIVEAGALVEGAKYVYVECYLNYDQFPIVKYRQIGLCTDVKPNQDILRAAAHSPTTKDEFTSVGVLEVIDNRAPSTRDVDQRELLSLILEY